LKKKNKKKVLSCFEGLGGKVATSAEDFNRSSAMPSGGKDYSVGRFPFVGEFEGEDYKTPRYEKYFIHRFWKWILPKSIPEI
jgi:hypothetical protein